MTTNNHKSSVSTTSGQGVASALVLFIFIRLVRELLGTFDLLKEETRTLIRHAPVTVNRVFR